ncbi:MAG: sugar ABC transporter ATP-binding protein [Solirubrobacteraceae bacterium]
METGSGVATPFADASADAPPVVSLRGIEKGYPGVQALKGVDLDVRPGVVHALVGENGAGKSTLIGVMSGVTAPDAGTIEIAGERIGHLTPRGARERGIRLVAQERQIALDLSVGENVLLGHMPLRHGRVDWRAVRAEAHRRLARVGLEIDPRTPARELGVAQLQALEIARALSTQARLVILDEPTAALGASEVERLFANIRELREAGVAVLYVSHHLGEIFAIADLVSVMRDGSHVATRAVDGLDVDGLVTLMLGQAPERLRQEVRSERSERSALRVEGLSCVPALRDVSLTVGEGEIVAVAGALGSGRRELARCIAGLQRPDGGKVAFGGRDAPPRSPREALRRGLVFLPEDRKREGLMLDLDVVENVGVGRLSLQRSPFVRPLTRQREARRQCGSLGVRAADVFTPVRTLSGGNQQKIMLGRWLGTGARMFVFDEPTAGIDVGAKLEIYDLLRRLAADGAGVLFFSSDLEEITLVAHRAVVLCKGRVAGVCSGADMTEDRMLSLLVGAA